MKRSGGKCALEAKVMLISREVIIKRDKRRTDRCGQEKVGISNVAGCEVGHPIVLDSRVSGRAGLDCQDIERSGKSHDRYSPPSDIERRTRYTPH